MQSNTKPSPILPQCNSDKKPEYYRHHKVDFMAEWRRHWAYLLSMIFTTYQNLLLWIWKTEHLLHLSMWPCHVCFCNRSNRNMSINAATFFGESFSPQLLPHAAEPSLWATDAASRSSGWLVLHCTVWWRATIVLSGWRCWFPIMGSPHVVPLGLFSKIPKQSDSLPKFPASCNNTQLSH